MEHGSFNNDSQSSFTLPGEDHTLANAVRFMLNQDPRVTVAGHSIPHPSLECVNIRVQTTGIENIQFQTSGAPAREVLKDACQELMLINRHVRSVFEKAVIEYKARKKAEDDAVAEELEKQMDKIDGMDIESN